VVPAACGVMGRSVLAATGEIAWCVSVEICWNTYHVATRCGWNNGIKASALRLVQPMSLLPHFSMTDTNRSYPLGLKL
jgi:hypothetical protein